LSAVRRSLPSELNPEGFYTSVQRLPIGCLALFHRLALGGVDAEDLIGYVAAVVSHAAFRAVFADELTTPGIRVPLTSDSALWSEAVALGHEVIWLHTYGARCDCDGRPA
jgi:Type ISP C-terminal specificity domain